MRYVISVYCDEEDVDTLKRAILRVRDNIQSNGGRGDIVVINYDLTPDSYSDPGTEEDL
jgi:hypothetical protein